MITLTATVVETARQSSEVRISCGDDAVVCYVTFTSRDMITMRHKDRAGCYARLISGTRTLADTILTLAEAEIHYMPRSGVDLQFIGSLVENDPDLRTPPATA